jgi:hypothetical protein
MGDIHYTKYDYDLHIKDLDQAIYAYYSGSPLAWSTGYTPLEILQGDQWWGTMLFQYRCSSSIWLAVGFYLEGHPNIYSWWWLYLPASGDYALAGVGRDDMTKPTIPEGIGNLSKLDAKWEIWLSPASLPRPDNAPDDYRIAEHTYSDAYIYLLPTEAQFDMSPGASYG